MIKKHRQNFILLIFCIDIGIICLSWWVSYVFRFHTGLLPIKYGIPDPLSYLNSLFLIVPIWTVSLVATSMYTLRRGGSLISELIKIIKSCTIALIFLVVILFFLKEDLQLSRIFLIVFWFFNIVLLILFRYVLRVVLKSIRRRGYNLRHVLILGGGRLGKRLVEKIHLELWAGYKIVGFLDDDIKVSHLSADVRRLGRVNELEKILLKENIETVFITIGMQNAYVIEKVINILSKYHVNVRIIPDIFQYDLLLNTSIEDLEGLPVISLVDSPMVGLNRLIKRIFDIVFSLSVLILLFPFYGLLAILIKLSSPGPILYRQERMSMEGKLFNIYKFRSMPVDVENTSGPKWAEKDDNRTTAVGQFLRRSSLDELPQFLNVLFGSMSVVGPRPERPVFIETFKNDIPKYMLRHKMKAGITGWAQVNGWRGNTSLEKRIECDIFYINNWSLILDIKIILMTFYKGFINKNAY